MKMTNQELTAHIETLAAKLAKAKAKYALSTNLIRTEVVCNNMQPITSEDVASLRVVKACRIKMEHLESRLNHAKGWLEQREFLAGRVDRQERPAKQKQVIGDLIRKQLQGA